jgi:hypothetical protein
MHHFPQDFVGLMAGIDQRQQQALGIHRAEGLRASPLWLRSFTTSILKSRASPRNQ